MRIVLLRHGIAIDREHPDCPPDPERFLTDRGVSRTRAAARGLRRWGVNPDRILTSPWRRARETAELCASTWGDDDVEVETLEALVPGHAAAEVLTALRGTDHAEVLLVGHAPLLDEIVAEAVGASGVGLCALKKAGAASVLWSRSTGEGHLEWLLPPRALRRLGRR